MIEWLGTAYTFGKQALGWYKDGKEAVRAAKELYEDGKGVKEHLQHEPAAEPEVTELSPKVVDLEWLVVSGFRDRVRAEGYKLRWSCPDAVPTRELDGYEVLYEVDQKAHTSRSLTRYDGSILIGKKG
jgi:hypothetical protein